MSEIKKKLSNSGLVANEVETIVFGNSQEMEEDELIKEMEAALASASAASKTQNPYIYDFHDVPLNLVFSEFSTYRLLKRHSKREFYINGKMLESRIGLNSSLYNKVLSRSVRAFKLGDDVCAFFRASVM